MKPVSPKGFAAVPAGASAAAAGAAALGALALVAGTVMLVAGTVMLVAGTVMLVAVTLDDVDGASSGGTATDAACVAGARLKATANASVTAVRRIWLLQAPCSIALCCQNE